MFSLLISSFLANEFYSNRYFGDLRCFFLGSLCVPLISNALLHGSLHVLKQVICQLWSTFCRFKSTRAGLQQQDFGDLYSLKPKISLLGLHARFREGVGTTGTKWSILFRSVLFEEKGKIAHSVFKHSSRASLHTLE